MKLPIYIADSAGVGVAALTFTGSEIQTSRNGAAFADAGGATGAIGLGAYYYQTTQSDESGALLTIRAAKAGYDAWVFACAPGVVDFAAGATGPSRYVPMYLVDAAGAPVTGAIPTGSEIQVSVDGAAWADGAGSWHSIGNGAYYYNPTTDEVSTPGLFMVKAAVTGAVTYIRAVQLGDAEADDPPDPIPITPVVAGDEEYLDIEALALSRLCQQFRGDT